jgi:NADPH:quinone reductase-like Zn-dependent oxidoreductase
LGDECAGRVVAVGAGVQGFNVGDPVVAIAPGCIASDVLADARLVAPRPLTLSPELSAGVPIELATGRLHVHRAKNGSPSVHPMQGDEIRALRRLQRERRPRHTGATGLAWSQEHPAHGALYRVGP